jgi:transcriptional regulator with XRE-family HTH domain
MQTRQEIGKQLREARQNAGYTQDQLSELTGLRKAQISLMESGSQNFTIDKILSICEILRVEIKIN